MESWGPLVALIPVWGVSVFGPGMVVVRRWGWDPVERICAAAAVSLFLLYLAALGIFLSGVGPWGHRVVFAGCVVCAGVCWRDWVRLWSVSRVRRTAGVLVFVLAWVVVCLGIVRHYSGGGWAVDWALHYKKVEMFFTGVVPTEMATVREQVIDRPAMMNLVGAYVAGVVGLRFDVFQVTFGWLNALAVLPCCLLAGIFGRRGSRGMWVLAAVLVCLPTFWEQTTYSWTKQLSAFYELLGIALYLRSLRKGDRGRMIFAFAMMATGILVHYVGVPYALLAGGHYLIFVWRRRERRWTELASILGCCAAVLATWFTWTAARYGWRELLVANSTLKHAGEDRGLPGAVMRAARTLVWDVVPQELRPGERMWDRQEHPLGRARDYFFLLYNMNRVLLTGTATGVVAGVLAYRRLRVRGRWDGAAWAAAGGGAVLVAAGWGVSGVRGVLEDLFPNALMKVLAVGVGAWLSATLVRWVRFEVGGGGWSRMSPGTGSGRKNVSNADVGTLEVWFWRGMLAVIPVVAAATLDVPGQYGTGHLYFQAWALVTATWVCVHVRRLRPWARRLLGAGMAVDFVLGVFLQFYVENMEFELTPAGELVTRGMDWPGVINWGAKVQRGWVFLGDRVGAGVGVLEIVLLVGGLAAALWVAAGAPRLGRWR